MFLHKDYKVQGHRSHEHREQSEQAREHNSTMRYEPEALCADAHNFCSCCFCVSC